MAPAGSSAWLPGRPGTSTEALATFSAAVRSLHAAGNLVDELDATVNLGDMWVAAGRPGRARRLYERALETATSGGGPFPRATADLHVGLAELDRELDDLTSAETHLETARVLGEAGSITENRHRWPMAMAQVRAARGDTGEASRLLEQAASLYRHGFYPDLRPIAALRARLQIAAGDLDAAATWAREAGVGVDDDPDFLHEYEHLTLVRLLLARHRASTSSDRQATGLTLAGALRLLDSLEQAADAAPRAGSLLEIRVLRALAHQAGGEIDAALTVLSQALHSTPEPESHVRVFLDEGAPMLDLLRDAPAPGRSRTGRWPGPADGQEHHQEVLRGWARRMLRHTGAAAEEPALAQPSDPLVDPLSHREIDVLRLLDSELSGPQIAEQLYVSLNTLRTHTKRIFTKLDVNSRAAAVRTAHERGLL